jgi:peroxiredoxin Q/BCP
VKGSHVTKPADGDTAPEFTLPTNDDGSFTLADQRGKHVVLFFYPKDDTSGCTAEAIDFSAQLEKFEAAGAIVIGISPDSPKKHDKFRAKYELTVALASDEEKLVCTAYGVWIEKSMYGKKYMGVDRSTFLVDPAGTISHSWRKVKVPGHVDEVLAALNS